MREYATTPMSRVMKLWPMDTEGIISIIGENEEIVRSKYGTFSQFISMVKRGRAQKKLISKAWCPSHDGFEIDIKGGWNDYIEEWVTFYGATANNYGVEFHTVAHYKHLRVKRGASADRDIMVGYKKPTRYNDTQFRAYAQTLRRGW